MLSEAVGLKLFTISIDTEADCSVDWTGAVPESYRNLTALRERLLPAIEKYGAIATLLLNGDIIERDGPSRICERLSHDVGWELGTHLHGEFVAPEVRHTSPAGIRLLDFQCGYGPEMEFRKMQTLTTMFRERFGYPPISFRAGRFGAGSRTFEICLKLGYEVDTSVVPGAIFQEGAAIADFRAFDFKPSIVACNETRRLVEIPVTVKPGLMKPVSHYLGLCGSRETKSLKFLRKFLARAKCRFDRMTLPLHKSTWLRPSFSTSSAMTGVLQWLANLEPHHPVVANMMFHSNELQAGASPYNASDAEVASFLERMSSTFGSARALGYQFVSLAEAGRLLGKLLV